MKKKTKALLLMLFALTLSFCFTACISGVKPTSDSSGSVPVVEPDEYAVTVNACEGATVEVAEKVEDAKDVSFAIVIADGYEKGEDFAVTVTVGGVAAAVSEEEDTYTVSAVKGDVIINVSGLVKQHFNVIAEAGEGVTINGAESVVFAEDYCFTLSLNDGYEKGEDFAVTATVGGVEAEISEEEGTYTVSAVKGDLTINVSGLVKKHFNVIKEPEEGAEINGADSVIFAEDYCFTVSFKKGYAADEDFEVLIDGDPAEYDTTEEYYVVRNVSSGFTIEVTGVKEVVYNVSFDCDYEDALLNQAESLKGTSENYVCSINLSDKYTQCQNDIEVYYSVDGVETKVEANEDREYVIANPQADMVIVVKNVSLNKYKVDFLLDGEIKYTQEGVVVDTELTDEQLAKAKAAVMEGEEGTFVGWNESLGLVKGDSQLNAVIVEGETVNLGNGFANATKAEGAPIGYENAYKETAVWDEANKSDGGAKTVWASIEETDLEPYQEIYFQIKVEKSWILFDGWEHWLANGDSELEGTIAVWTLIKLEKVDNGWNVTFTGNSGTTTFREGFYLNDILTFEYDARTKELGFDDCIPTEIFVTDMIAVKDENYVAGVREVVTDNIFANSTLSEETAPKGYTNVYYEKAAFDTNKQSSGGAATVWADIVNCDVSKYKLLTFRVKVSGSWILFDGWSHYFVANNEWITVTMEKTETGWDITFNDSTTSREGTNLKDLLKMEFDARTVENGYADCQPSEIYTTEIIGVVDENYDEVTFDKIAESAYDAGIDVGGGKQFEATTEIEPAAGFENVYKYQSTEGNIHGRHFSGIDLTKYKTVTFALKTASFNFNAEATKETSDWMIFTLTQASAATWDLVVTCDGETIFKKTGLNGAYSTNENYTNNALDAILYGNPSGFYPQAKDGDLTVYVSELRGEKDPDYVEPTPVVGDKIAESAYDAGIDVGGGQQFEQTTEIAPAAGFENVYKYQSTESNIHGKNFSGIDLTKYSKVSFALKTASFNFNNEATKETSDWMIFTLTQASAATWDLVVTCDGETIFTKSGLNGTYSTNDAYTNNALDAILYGNPSGFYPQAKDGDLTVYVSELRGEKDANYVEPTPVTGDKIAESAYDAGIDVGGGQQFEQTTEIAPAAGFENVYKYQSTESNIHGKNFSGVDLTEYKTVTFALKTASFNFNNEATKETSDWMIFTLTQVSAATWDLVVTCDGETIFTKSGLNGAYSTNDAYTNNALDAILYGNPSGFYPQAKDGDLTVYVSELRGEKA